MTSLTCQSSCDFWNATTGGVCCAGPGEPQKRPGAASMCQMAVKNRIAADTLATGFADRDPNMAQNCIAFLIPVERAEAWKKLAITSTTTAAADSLGLKLV